MSPHIPAWLRARFGSGGRREPTPEAIGGVRVAAVHRPATLVGTLRTPYRPAADDGTAPQDNVRNR